MEPFQTSRVDQRGAYRIHVARLLQGGQGDLDPLLLRPSGPVSDGPFALEYAGGGVAEVQPVLHLLGDWRSRYYHFRALRSGAPRSANMAAAKRLDPTGQNLIAVLLEMLTNRSQLLTN
jgi:hypothetical protein